MCKAPLLFFYQHTMKRGVCKMNFRSHRGRAVPVMGTMHETDDRTETALLQSDENKFSA